MDIGKLKSMADTGERMQLADVPTQFVGKLEKEEVKTDKQGRECLYWSIAYAGKVITQKFTPMQLQYLVEALKGLGVSSTDFLKGKNIEFTLKSFRIGNPRHLPTKIIED
jgi:hypothetical protein